MFRIIQDVCPACGIPAHSARRPVLSWFIQTVGFWGLLTLVAAACAFCWSVIAVLRPPDSQFNRSSSIILLIPTVVGLIGAVVKGYSAFASIREFEMDLTAVETVFEVDRAAWVPLLDAVLLTTPSLLVLAVGRVIRARRGGPVAN